MEIVFNYNELTETACRSLSIIGKRATSDDGKPLFEDVTLSSNEKTLISDYIRQAIIDLSAELAFAITSSTDTSITVTLPDNHKTALETFINQSCITYCVSYALYSWFNVTLPRIAGKYQGDCARQMNVLKRILHEKEEPGACSSSYEDITGEITNDNDNEND